MAFTVSSLTNYFERSSELLATSTLLSNELTRYRFEDDVQYSKKIDTMDVTMYAQAGACGLTASGNTTFSESSIEVSPIAYKLKYCFEDLQKKGMRIERQAIAKGLEDQAIEDALTMEHVMQIKSDIEDLLWVGDTGSGDLIDGWFQIAIDDSDTLHIDSDYGDLVQTGITTSNIDEYVQSFIDKAVETEALWGAVNQGEYLTIHVAPNLFNLYKQYQLSNNLFRDADKNLAVKEMWVSGYEGQVTIKEEQALAVSTSTDKPKVIMSYDQNLVYGSSLVDDVTEPKAEWVIDNVTDYVYFKSAFRLGATIVFPSAVITNYSA